MSTILSSLVFTVTALLCACNSRTDSFSNWFVKYEDSLYADYIKYLVVNEVDTTPGIIPNGVKLCINTPIDFSKTDAWISEVLNRVKEYDDNLIVKMWYDQCDSPNARIEISTGYNPPLVKSLDQVLINVLHPKHFKIEKYIQPNTTSEIISLNSFVDISVNDIRIKLTNGNTFEDLTVFLYTKEVYYFENADWSRHFLKENLFGEELLLKKMGKVNFIRTDSIDNNLYTLKQLREKLRS